MGIGSPDSKVFSIDKGVIKLAERRMFAKTIIDSDAFLDMPLSSQALYFHLAMRADDDGFVNNPKRIQRTVGASDDDCKLLVMKRFILTFPSGVIAIKHWRIHNYIQKDRYKETVYTKEKSKLYINQNNAYTDKASEGKPLIVSTMTQNGGGECLNVAENARETYDDVMNDMQLEDGVKPIMWRFIKHCQLNGRTLTNDKLADILYEMDKQRLDEDEKIEALQTAINGGYFDIKR